ncbi:hypothetical protein EJ03DRAFT_375291 [Teratosphaeria nubilosa]|uniref:Cation efflux protein transmembrane domain-containing protein n=1 Tax=Teratosphaeria nubilosa TaxID=161662 RepID=A0A6G1L716_9PEZI|nr:hypothetical protein EJ03DRAFT_375291 [Teratosphaeria nubilosa]
MSDRDDSSLRLYRTSTLKDFLSASQDDSALSTRGQHLPGLIVPRSSSNIAGMRKGFGRRKSSSIGYGHGEDQPRRSHDDDPSDADPDTPSRLRSTAAAWSGPSDDHDEHDRRMSVAASILLTPQMRSQRLIGNSNPRYQWEQYWKSDEELKKMSKPLRKYYERNNMLIQHYMYIDKLLDSSLPHHLIQEYNQPGSNSSTSRPFDPSDVPAIITEEGPTPHDSPEIPGKVQQPSPDGSMIMNGNGGVQKVKRTPNNIYRHKEVDTSDESTPLLNKPSPSSEDGSALESQPFPPDLEPDDDVGSQSRIVTIAIAVNGAANVVLLIMKVIVAALTNSVSVFASLVDAALDFLSTAIVWISTYLIASSDQYAYPIGRRRLEPVGVLVFSVIMCTAFFQVAIEGVQKLAGPDHTVVRLTAPAIAIMVATVVVKLACWFWCRLIKNSSVQALAQDAMTDVIFNTFSIIFPLIGFYANVWWLDPLGGVLLSAYVITNWARTSSEHIRNLTGCAATADERNILLYLTMRFAKTIKQIQGLQAYHSGDKLNVEVDLVLDEGTTLRDSHDLGESLQYVLESVPNVDRAFVHLDYASYNLPSHMQQE